MKSEMTPEKVHLIATAKVSSKHKERWWNMSKESHQEYNFPPQPASVSHLQVWIDQAAFWAGVSCNLLPISCEMIYLIFDVMIYL